MEFNQIIKDKTYGEVKTLLNSAPYSLNVQEDKEMNVYMVKYGKDDIIDDIITENDVTSKCRGIILEKDTNKVLCYSFNRKEIPTNTEEFLQNNWNNLRFEEAIDGSQVRIYYHNDVWNVTTTRCIRAGNAFWYSTKSFETLFRECYDLNYDALNQNYCYSFVIRHSENRIVAKYEDNSLVHVLTRDMTTPNYDIVECDIGVMKPPVISVESVDALLEMVKSSTRTDIEGVFIWHGDKHFKLRFDAYNNIKRLRNNTRDLFFEYVENKIAGQVDEYKTSFSEYQYDIDYYESILKDLVNKIHRLYMEVHVEKTRIIKIVDKSFHRHLYNLHGKYIKERIKITKDVVTNFLLSLDAKQIMHLINIHYRRIPEVVHDVVPEVVPDAVPDVVPE